jgi:uncharacterized protein
MLQILFDNVMHNLFKPLLLFFYAGFMIPVLGIAFEFPQVIYQALTIYLLLAIGWRGGEELAGLPSEMLNQAGGFMALGFVTNLLVGIATYYVLIWATRLRKVDAAVVAGHYGSDSAGTFVTCVGVLAASQVAFASYMPVLLAVMEVPGCLVALLIVSRLRQRGMDAAGNMPNEAGHEAQRQILVARVSPTGVRRRTAAASFDSTMPDEADLESQLVGVAAGDEFEAAAPAYGIHSRNGASNRSATYRKTGGGPGRDDPSELPREEHDGSAEFDLEEFSPAESPVAPKSPTPRMGKLLHEVFLNPGTFLLFAGLAIGFISRRQGEEIVAKNDTLFVSLFQGMLCLFLLEMGMTASKRLKDLRTVGWQFAAFALIAPNVFAVSGMALAHLYGMTFGYQLQLGTYVLFGVLCGSASYIAVPAIQRLAIPEASPTLPLAASLGLTFTYNVTVGIPVYLMVATALMTYLPIAA